MDVSFQLYSAREFTPWEDVLKMIAGLGYTQVEGFGGVYADPAAFKALLDQNGLTMPSGHFFPIGTLEEDFFTSVATARTLGMERVFCPAPEDLWRNGTDAANWIALAKRLEEVCKRMNDSGLRFGWHNHHWEFMPLPTGEIPMQLLLDHAPSIEWEVDVAWIWRSGANTLRWMEDNKDRITTAHIKDVAQEGRNLDEDGWADVCEGEIPWLTHMRMLRAVGCDLFVMEHDKPSDVERFARISMRNFKEL